MNVTSDEILKLAEKVERKVNILAKSGDVSRPMHMAFNLPELQFILHGLIKYYDEQNRKEVLYNELNKL